MCLRSDQQREAVTTSGASRGTYSTTTKQRQIRENPDGGRRQHGSVVSSTAQTARSYMWHRLRTISPELSSSNSPNARLANFVRLRSK